METYKHWSGIKAHAVCRTVEYHKAQTTSEAPLRSESVMNRYHTAHTKPSGRVLFFQLKDIYPPD